MIKNTRKNTGVNSLGCGTVEIMRLRGSAKDVCGSIRIRAARDRIMIHGRELVLEFRGCGYQQMDVKLLYEIIVDTLEASGRYKVGWKSHEHSISKPKKEMKG